MLEYYVRVSVLTTLLYGYIGCVSFFTKLSCLYLCVFLLKEVVSSWFARRPMSFSSSSLFLSANVSVDHWYVCVYSIVIALLLLQYVVVWVCAVALPSGLLSLSFGCLCAAVCLTGSCSEHSKMDSGSCCSGLVLLGLCTVHRRCRASTAERIGHLPFVPTLRCYWMVNSR